MGSSRQLVSDEVIDDLIRTHQWPGLVVVDTRSGIGRGVTASIDFSKDSVVCNYSGTLLQGQEVSDYLKTDSPTEYCYEFRHSNQRYVINSQVDNGTIGRLFNHSAKYPNLKTRVKVVDGQPTIIFSAKEHITKGDDLLFDYGERSAGGLRPDWLDQCSCTKICNPVLTAQKRSLSDKDGPPSKKRK